MFEYINNVRKNCDIEVSEIGCLTSHATIFQFYEYM